MTIPSLLAGGSAATPKATSSATNSATTTVSSTNPGSTLDQSDFLKLLVAQIQYQDPMNPQSDTQMAAQLAQFTSLQQATQSSTSLAMLQANSLVGSTVTVAKDAKHSASGLVTGVVMENGVPKITVGGLNYGLSQVIAITPGVATGAAGATDGTTGGTSGGSSSSGTQVTQ